MTVRQFVGWGLVALAIAIILFAPTGTTSITVHTPHGGLPTFGPTTFVPDVPVAVATLVGVLALGIGGAYVAIRGDRQPDS